MRKPARVISAVLLVAAAVSAANVGGAATSPTWIQLSPKSSPPARSGASMAFDAAASQLVLFGGGSGFGGTFNDTYSWNGSTWVVLTPRTGAPSVRDYAAMAYDPMTREVLLFGGADVNDHPLGDTWAWNGSDWTQVNTTGPEARLGASMAFDQTNNQLLLFGGQGATGSLADTWKWTGTAWQQLALTGPPARQFASMTFDPASGQLILFGGQSTAGSGATFADTWTWNGSSWSQLSAGPNPPARSNASMAFDPTTQQVLLFGGTNFSALQVFNDTWEWNGKAWSAQSPSNSPPARYGASMDSDAATGQLILFGGVNGGAGADTWDWGLPPAAQTPSTTSPPTTVARTAAAGASPVAQAVSAKPNFTG